MYDFIGFNEYFLAKNEPADIGEPNVIVANLGDDLLERLDITSLAELQDFVRGRVAETAATTTTTLVEFALGGTRDFFRLVNETIPDHPADFDLRAVYFEKRSAEPWPSSFRRGSTRILIHVRQGDTAALETPWHTVMSLWPRERWFTEYARFDDIPADHRLLRVEDFHAFFKEVVSRIDRPLSTLLFSDGFKGSLRRLNRQGARHGLTPRQIETLNVAVRSFDKTKFRPFKDVDNCDLFVGEEPENLFHLIHSFLEADLVIIGPQGSMIPKLIRHFCDVQNMPIVIVLSRSNESMSRALGGFSKLDKVVLVNVNQPDYDAVASRVSDLLEKANGAG